MIEGGLTGDEVERAKTRLQAGVIYAKDSPTSAAQAVGSLLAVGMTLDQIEEWPARVAAVTAEQVNAAAHALFTSAPNGTGVLLPEGAV